MVMVFTELIKSETMRTTVTTVRGYLEDIIPGLLPIEARHLGKLVDGLDADAAILVCSVLHKVLHAQSAHLCHALVQLHILENSLHRCSIDQSVLLFTTIT